VATFEYSPEEILPIVHDAVVIIFKIVSRVFQALLVEVISVLCQHREICVRCWLMAVMNITNPHLLIYGLTNCMAFSPQSNYTD
jgi:hypothetical protein